jgi:hypothetical protein
MRVLVLIFVSLTCILLSGVHTENVDEQQPLKVVPSVQSAPSSHVPLSVTDTLVIPTKKIDLHLDSSNSSSMFLNGSLLSSLIPNYQKNESAIFSNLNISINVSSSSQAQSVEDLASPDPQQNRKSTPIKKQPEVPKEDEEKASPTTLKISTSTLTVSTSTSSRKVADALPEQKEVDADKKPVEEEKGAKTSETEEIERPLDYCSLDSKKSPINPKFPVKLDENSGGGGHFFVFACIGLGLCITLYLAYQSRGKILAYLIEGKRPSRSRTRQASNSRDRSNVAYKPLNNQTSTVPETNKGFIY